MMSMRRKEEELEEVIKIRVIITDTNFTSLETETTLLIWALNNLKAIQIDIHTLKTTGIGKVVNHLRKHKSDRVSEIATGLIKKWKAIVRDTCEETTVTTLTPVSAGRSAAAAVEPNAPTSSSRPTMKIRLVVGKSDPKPESAAATAEPNAPTSSMEIINIQMQEQQIQEVIADKGTGGMNKEATAAVNVNTRMNNNRTDKRTTTSPAVHSSIKATNQTITTKKTMYEEEEEEEEEEVAASAKSLQSKLETSKRKLHDSYQQFQDAKKQRTIKVIDNSDVPKPSREAAAGTNSKAVKTSKQAAIRKRLNMMKRNNLHRSKVLLPY